MSSLFRTQQSFLQNTAWQNQAKNALHYNTAQQGSVIPLIYGTTRQQVNVIDLKNYRGPQGKKGKVGSLPLAGTSQTGKGGGDSKGGKGGGKKSGNYSVDVDFAICQGPVTFNSSNGVYSSSGVETFASSGLNFYTGEDAQAADGTFSSLGYSGTCHITGTPLDLGQSPVLPNIAFEITGILAGVHVGQNVRDANPADVITDFLTNPRYGAEFPAFALSLLTHDDSGHIHNTYGDYCQASSLTIAISLDGHQKAIEWLDGITKLTNSALVWSAGLLRIIPYGDLALNANGAKWTPDFHPKYDLTDDHFLPLRPRQEGTPPNPGDDDPIVITRINPTDADNWVSIEYTDKANFYNSTIITAFDQGAIDTYGLRIGDSIPGRTFTNPTSAQISLQLMLQRKLYVRNTGIKFQVGWQFALLEPMDFVSLTGRFGDNYLQKFPVRITAIEENDNGDLLITAEDPQPGVAHPITSPLPIGAVDIQGLCLLWPLGTYTDPITGEILQRDPGRCSWPQTRPPDSPTGTFSTWMRVPHALRPVPPGHPFDPNGSNQQVSGLMRTKSFIDIHRPYVNNLLEIAFYFDYNGALHGYLAGVQVYLSHDGVIKFDGSWQHVLASWNVPNFRCWVDGAEKNNLTSGAPTHSTVRYSWEWSMQFYSVGGLFSWAASIEGCAQDGWFDASAVVTDPQKFRTLAGLPADLGFRGENVIGRPPTCYFHYYPTGTAYSIDPTTGLLGPGADPRVILDGAFYYYINRAGFRPDWITLPPHNYWPDGGGDPAHPNMLPYGATLKPCDTNPF